MAKFHITRIRQQGADWYDPQTDIKKIIPDVIENISSAMEDMCSDKMEIAHLRYLHECFRIFVIRMTEDSTPLDSQLEEFFKALSVCPVDVLFKWYMQVVSALLCIFGLFSRRDSAASKSEYTTMLEYTRLCSLKSYLPAGVWNKLIAEYAARSSLFTSLVVDNATVSGGCAVTENGHVLEGLKKLACRYMSCSGAEGWNELAEACDKAFEDGREKTDMEAIALGLSYPTYKYPTMQLEIDDGLEDKAEQAEDKGRPCPV